jgi:hypothetical protein
MTLIFKKFFQKKTARIASRRFDFASISIRARLRFDRRNFPCLPVQASTLHSRLLPAQADYAL